MANRTSYLIILTIFAFNLLVASTNELDIWNGELDAVDLNQDDLQTGITDLTDSSDLEPGDDVEIDYFQLPGLVAKSFKLFIIAIAAIPFSGILLYSYGMPLAVSAIVEGLNLIMLAFLWVEFASNRRASQ